MSASSVHQTAVAVSCTDEPQLRASAVQTQQHSTAALTTSTPHQLSQTDAGESLSAVAADSAPGGSRTGTQLPLASPSVLLPCVAYASRHWSLRSSARAESQRGREVQRQHYSSRDRADSSRQQQTAASNSSRMQQPVRHRASERETQSALQQPMTGRHSLQHSSIRAKAHDSLTGRRGSGARETGRTHSRSASRPPSDLSRTAEFSLQPFVTVE